MEWALLLRSAPHFADSEPAPMFQDYHRESLCRAAFPAFLILGLLVMISAILSLAIGAGGGIWPALAGFVVLLGMAICRWLLTHPGGRPYGRGLFQLMVALAAGG